MNRYLLIITLVFSTFAGLSQSLPLDSSFGLNGFASATLPKLYMAAVQADGKIVAVAPTGSLFRQYIVIRYKTNGIVDNTFGVNGKTTVDLLSNSATRDIRIQSDGKIVLLFDKRGDLEARAVMIRINANGSIDNTFGVNGVVTIFYGHATPGTGIYFGTISFDLQKDDKIILAVPDYLQPDSPYVLRRFNTNGAPDPSFGNGGARNVETSAGSYIAFTSNVLVQDDGKIILVGSMLQDYVTMIVRCNTNGDYDKTFNGTGRVNNFPIGDVRAVAKQKDGKILLAAAYINSTRIVRYNTDGTVDNSYGNSGYSFTQYIPSNAWGTLHTLEVQKDGKILTSSIYTHTTPFYSTSAGALRYNPNGTLDATFAAKGKFFDIPTGSGMVLSPDNKRIYFFGSDSIVAYKSGVISPCDNDVTSPLITCIEAISFDYNSKSYNIPVIIASDNCGVRSIVYEMTGATTRSGSGNNASGELRKGVTYLKWTVKDSAGNASTCTTIITVKHQGNHKDLEVNYYPNPSSTYFIITPRSADTKHRVQVRVFSSYGKLVEVKWINPNEASQIGGTYRSGYYYFYFNQAGQKATIVLQKIN